MRDPLGSGSIRHAHRAALEIPNAGLALRPFGDDPLRNHSVPLAGGSSLIAGVGSTPVSGSQCLAGLPLDRRRLLGESGRRVRCTQALLHCRYVGDLRSFRSDGKGAIMISHRTKQLIGLCTCFWLLAVGYPSITQRQIVLVGCGLLNTRHDTRLGAVPPTKRGRRGCGGRRGDHIL